MKDSENVVTEAAMRPASSKPECFYCKVPLGGIHHNTCATIRKKVMVRMTVEYEVDVPAHWDSNMVNYHRNEGGWCGGNAIEELQDLAGESECLCGFVKFDYLRDTSEPFLNEGP